MGNWKALVRKLTALAFCADRNYDKNIGGALALAESAGFFRAFVDIGEPLRQSFLSLHDSSSMVSQEYLVRLLEAMPVHVSSCAAFAKSITLIGERACPPEG
jgi:hypothetical protein